jgi:hypothetical protein
MSILTEKQVEVMASITACIDLGLSFNVKDGILTCKGFHNIQPMNLEDVSWRLMKDCFYQAFGEAEEIQGGFEDESEDWIKRFTGKHSEDLGYLTFDVNEVIKHVK